MSATARKPSPAAAELTQRGCHAAGKGRSEGVKTLYHWVSEEQRPHSFPLSIRPIRRVSLHQAQFKLRRVCLNISTIPSTMGLQIRLGTLDVTLTYTQAWIVQIQSCLGLSMPNLQSKREAQAESTGERQPSTYCSEDTVDKHQERLTPLVSMLSSDFLFSLQISIPGQSSVDTLQRVCLRYGYLDPNEIILGVLASELHKGL
ncbi:hypothetical protein UY3_03000 [Chelonia mydas]|uniref:Uncharacterized protein n=1 Tax=Chelonia mydas TaxID=8469 RepID=M7C5S1_CHEMY|nr:hypothetical protein UY3_03000 [Chelonia mydas]